MRSRRYLSQSVWVITLALMVAVPKRATAQDEKRVAVAGGYSSMRDYDGDATFPRGWFASVETDVAGPLAAVGDASGSYKSMHGLDLNMSWSIHTIMGGPRVVWRTSRIAPYVQMLFGVARIATTLEVPEETLSAAQNHFAIAPGGGVDVRFSDRAALRAGMSLRLIRSETYTPAGAEPFIFRELQFIAGVVVR